MILVQLPGTDEDAFQKITSVGLSKCSVRHLCEGSASLRNVCRLRDAPCIPQSLRRSLEGKVRISVPGIILLS